MIDYDSFSLCHLMDIFFAIFAGARELTYLENKLLIGVKDLEINVDLFTLSNTHVYTSCSSRKFVTKSLRLFAVDAQD